MEVVSLDSGSIARMFTQGVELKYKGNSLVYDDKFVTLIYFYWPNYSCVYAVDGFAKTDVVPQVKGKCRKIFRLEGKNVGRLKKVVSLHPSLFRLGYEFFISLASVIDTSSWKSQSEILWKYHTGFFNGSV